MIITRSISDIIRDHVPICETTNEFLGATRQKFKESKKTAFGNLLSNFTNA